MSELTESLRHMADDSMGMEPGDRQVFSEAADRIEELEASNKSLVRVEISMMKESEELKAEPARLQEILLRQTKLNTKIINEKIALQTQLKAVRGDVWHEAVNRTEYVYPDHEVIAYLLAEVSSLLEQNQETGE
jgi:hypothetical protein